MPHGRSADVVELLALRNIIVHSRGIVDERYKAAVPASTLELGQKRGLKADDFFNGIELLSQVARLTDAAIAGKFDIAQVEVRDELNRRAAERWPKISKKEQKDTGHCGDGVKDEP